MEDEVDLLIVGGGPAGLAAAINGASEGLKVRILDNGTSLGGQARESSAIENYPGFPDSITGLDLMGRFVRQADKFNAGFFCPCHGAVLQPGGDGAPHTIISDDYQAHRARSIILSLGVNYKRLNAENISQFIGRGVFYGVPSWNLGKARTVGVIGGANSAGQAVVQLAKHKSTKVRMFIRRKLEVSMSAYLVERIRNLDNVEVLEDCEIQACHGAASLKEVTYKCNGVLYTCPLDALHIFIGAIPKTMWVEQQIDLDPQKFVFTGGPDRLPFETSIKGIFAAGDVRSGSTKRIATAIGEGVNALQSVHKSLGV